jgi:hypothetical protein
MPDTASGGPAGNSSSGPIILIGFLLLVGGLGFAVIRRLQTSRLS